MSRKFRHLTINKLLSIHRTAMHRFDCNDKVRDFTAAASVIRRAKCSFYPELIQRATALVEELLITRPFVAGNKLSAMLACDVFLRLNRKCIVCKSDELVTMVTNWAIVNANVRFRVIASDLRAIVQDI